MFIWIYRLIFAPLLILGSPKFLMRMRKRGGYREGFKTRFGLGLDLPPKRADKKRIWLQAVSLGEMLAMEPLINALNEAGNREVFLTTTTSTGYAAAKEKYGHMTVGIAYFPLDFWPFCRRVWKTVQPDLAIVAETELWPEFLHQARKSKVPVALVNGRLSDKSYRLMLKLSFLFRKQLEGLSLVLAGSEMDAERFVGIGLSKDRVSVTGNLKIDVSIEPILDDAEKVDLKSELGLGNDFVLLGSSTWPGEEGMLIEAFRLLRTKLDCRLLIVPRHAERRDELKSLMRDAAGEFNVHFKSAGLPNGSVDILVADTHGELKRLTQVSDLAFIGKSLPPHTEGQTPVECGGLGVPIVFGRGMRNFRSIRDQLLAYGAAIEVDDEAAAIAKLVELSTDEPSRIAMGEAGQLWHQNSKGAVHRTIEALDQVLDSGEICGEA